MLSFRQAGCLFETISYARTRVHMEGKYVRTRIVCRDFPSVRRSCREIYGAAALEAAAVAGFLASAIAAAPSNPSFRNPSLPNWRILCRPKYSTHLYTRHTYADEKFYNFSYLFFNIFFNISGITRDLNKFQSIPCYFIFAEYTSYANQNQ